MGMVDDRPTGGGIPLEAEGTDPGPDEVQPLVGGQAVELEQVADPGGREIGLHDTSPSECVQICQSTLLTELSTWYTLRT